MPPKTHASRLLDHVRTHGTVRPRDLQRLGIPRQVLKRLHDRGELVRRSRGVYSLPDHEPTRHTDLATVCARSRNATICLISALDFHELSTQIPRAVWIMIDRSGRRPRIDRPPIHVVYASGKSLSAGVKRHEIEGVEVPVTTPAKTVADCFKYRDHVGLDVAIEALRDCLRQRKATPNDIYEMAKIDRVTTTTRPYLEALI
jgi:predicted transcriptional regulator of viral defense system